VALLHTHSCGWAPPPRLHQELHRSPSNP
jgi:hypothetical protein